MTATTFIHAVTIGDLNGQLSFGYVAEYGAVLLNASVPSDLRRAPISIRLTDTKLLRDTLAALEAAIESEAKRRAASQLAKDGLFIEEQTDSVSITISGTAISLSRTLYDEAAKLVSEGSTILAAGLIGKSVPWLGAAGAKELARAIYEKLRAEGLRE